MPAADCFHKADEGGDAEKDDEVTGDFPGDQAKASADQECILDGFFVNEGRFEHGVDILDAEAWYGECELDFEDFTANAHRTLKDNVADFGQGFLSDGGFLAGGNFVFHNGAGEGLGILGANHEARVTFQGAGKDLMDAPDLTFENAGQGRGEILKQNDFNTRDIEGDAFAGQVAKGTGCAAISDIDQFGERIELRKERAHPRAPSVTR